jgi:hypothetical protein
VVDPVAALETGRAESIPDCRGKECVGSDRAAAWLEALLVFSTPSESSWTVRQR